MITFRCCTSAASVRTAESDTLIAAHEAREGVGLNMRLYLVGARDGGDYVRMLKDLIRGTRRRQPRLGHRVGASEQVPGLYPPGVGRRGAAPFQSA
jgi:hypothetical protein